MNVEEIKHLKEAQPFHPFKLRLSGGVEFEIGSPDHVAINPFTKTVYLFTETTVYRVTPEQVLFTGSKE